MLVVDFALITSWMQLTLMSIATLSRLSQLCANWTWTMLNPRKSRLTILYFTAWLLTNVI